MPGLQLIQLNREQLYLQKAKVNHCEVTTKHNRCHLCPWKKAKIKTLLHFVLQIKMAVINLCQLPALLQGTVFIKPKDFFQGLIVVQLILVVKSRNIFLQVD